MLACAETNQSPALPVRPEVKKLGTIAIDLCETTPFVLKGKAYRLEWYRKGSYLRIIDHATNKEVSRFGDHYRFPCAYSENDTVYVIGTKEDRGWFGNTLDVFVSKDLVHWEDHVAFHDPDYGICNTSVCKADGRYVMSIEVNSASKDTNGTFAGRFLESKDLIHWTLTPRECRHGFNMGLCSPHLLRWDNGWFYLFSTVSGYPTGYVLLLDRSHDLKTWDPSPFNPAMAADKDDKLIYNAQFSIEERDKIAKATDCDNSDIDFCDFNGRLLINYCWGNQVGSEFVAEAEYAGSTAQYLESWFPDTSKWAGIDIRQPLSTFALHRNQYGCVLTATNSKVTTSSIQGGSDAGNQALLSGTFSGPFAFHTEAETNPWVTIDLGGLASITGVLVRNRSDCCQERADTLRLQISTDGKTWQPVWTAPRTGSGWEIPLLGKDIKARYLRFDTRPSVATPLHLQHIEAWGRK
jgi:hypothetical protein